MGHGDPLSGQELTGKVAATVGPPPQAGSDQDVVFVQVRQGWHIGSGQAQAAWDRFAQGIPGDTGGREFNPVRAQMITGGLIFADYVFCYGMVSGSLVSIFSPVAGEVLFGLGNMVSGAFYDAIVPMVGFVIFAGVENLPSLIP